ncbi:hypothetical protein [Fusobacterium necrophorum]|uniref:hypothetical protein n=1 Tax=Fusobacterium necrophorum TaxID=859 RepID=UPI000786B435|nr:hypothetical protein [Fusobacterium necrophorum]AYV95952.1 hypothetical protein BWX37_10100 [Fusobacterium necrophorum subsp. funduliforme]KYL02264.1 hypothetical protein A2J06_10765 [Fusobacterium necrophorum subsp. funduliforme]
MKTIKIGTEENYVEIKEMMSFWEKREYQYGFGGIYAMNKDASRIEVNTRKPFEETEEYFLLKSQVMTIAENGDIIYDNADAKQRKEFSKVLKNAYGETSKNLEEALAKIKEVNELVKKEEKEEKEEEKND